MNIKSVLCGILISWMEMSAQAQPVQLNFDNQPLSSVLTSVQQHSGVEVRWDPSLAADHFSGNIQEEAWQEVFRSVLEGYNYSTINADDGQLRQVIVSGRNGNGHFQTNLATSAVKLGGDLLIYQTLGETPEKYRDLLPGSVSPVDLPVESLLQMQLGDRIDLMLPNGVYEVVYDNFFQHENGDFSWVGHLNQGDESDRVILTLGQNGSIGQIVTPEGVFNLDAEGGRTWLIDLDASGLQASGLENDDLNPEAEAEQVFSEAGNVVSGATSTPVKSAGTATVPAGTPVVDVLVLYTQGMNKSTLDTRLNYLLAKANQAYIDSQIKMQLRFVGKALVNYPDASLNDTALSDLSAGRGAFSGVAAARASTGADLVTLIRPFGYKSQISCGVAWVNGANGTDLRSGLGYSVVSDGKDVGGSGYYCSDYTFVHELGHNMGSSHDREHSNVAGKYNYSYGYGQSGKYGTIMSYYNPVVGYFSNPNLSYKGQILGKAATAADAANNALSLNQTANLVANFNSAANSSTLATK